MQEQISLPAALRPINSRSPKEWNTAMMEKYTRMAEDYKNAHIIEQPQNKLKDDDTNGMLTFEETDVFHFFSKAKIEMNQIIKNNTDIVNDIQKYESFITDINKFQDYIKQANELYVNLSDTIQISNIDNKLLINQNILPNENKVNISNCMSDIHKKIEELNTQLSINNNKITDFKKIILKCASGEKVKHNICNVCDTNKINICINPCGHTFCSKCIEKMNSKCGMCRGKIETKIKIYIDYDSETEEGEDDNAEVEIQPTASSGWLSPGGLSPAEFMIERHQASERNESWFDFRTIFR